MTREELDKLSDILAMTIGVDHHLDQIKKRLQDLNINDVILDYSIEDAMARNKKFRERIHEFSVSRQNGYDKPMD